MSRLIAAALVAIQTLTIVLPAARAHAEAAAPFPVVPLERPSPRRHTWAYLTLAAGATLVGLSFSYSAKADQTYEAYLVSTDQVEIQTLYDRTLRYDRRAQVSLLTGEAMLAAGLYLRFIRRPAPPRGALLLGPTRCALSCRF